jgi:alcohol dehydrogenase
LVPTVGNGFVERRSLLLKAPRRLEWTSEGLPPLSSGEVLVRTDAGSISVGSELPLYRGDARSVSPVRYPLMTGYENVGTVVGCGEGVAGLRPGQRVFASYGHRTHGVLSEEKVVEVPEDVSDGLALLAILSCDVAKGVRKVAPSSEEPVLVTGAGAIGLLTVFVLGAYEISSVDVIEPLAERRTLAERLGARSVHEPEASLPDGYAAAFECSGRDDGFSLLQRKLGNGGRLCVLSDGNLEPLVLCPEFHHKELAVVGSSDGWDYREHARWFFDVVRGAETGLEEIFDLRVDAEDLPRTFENLANGPVRPIKVMVNYRTSYP